MALGLVGLWLGSAVVFVLAGIWDAREGQQAATAARGALDAEAISSGRAEGHLRRAERRFDRAGRLLGSPVLLPVRVLPIVGRQLAAAAALASGSSSVADAGVALTSQLRDVLQAPKSTGQERVVALARARRAVATAQRKVDAADIGPGRALVGPLADAYLEADEELAEARTTLAKAVVATTGLEAFFRGPRTYLVLAANNAEMRSGSGTFLSAGVLSTDRGTLSLGGFRPATELSPTRDLPMDQDLEALWGWMEPDKEFRNLAASPRFVPNADLAARMWTTTTGQDVDGVLVLDPVALAAVLAATGPVTVAGERVDSGGVVDRLLHDQYVRDVDVVEEGQEERREELGAIAQAAFEAVDGGRADLGRLATGLADAVAGRHLLAWAREPAELEAWRSAGATGELLASSLMVSVINRGGNKLDRFLDVNVEVRERGNGDTDLRVRLRNRTPAGEPRYVAGPNPELPRGTRAASGEYIGLVTVSAPGETSGLTLEEGPPYAAAGPDGPTRVLSKAVRVQRGVERTLVFRLRLPRSVVRVEPSARVPASQWDVDGETFTDDRPRTLPRA